jgi:hypothetical protein
MHNLQNYEYLPCSCDAASKTIPRGPKLYGTELATVTTKTVGQLLDSALKPTEQAGAF